MGRFWFVLDVATRGVDVIVLSFPLYPPPPPPPHLFFTLLFFCLLLQSTVFLSTFSFSLRIFLDFLSRLRTVIRYRKGRNEEEEDKEERDNKVSEGEKVEG